MLVLGTVLEYIIDFGPFHLCALQLNPFPLTVDDVFQNGAKHQQLLYHQSLSCSHFPARACAQPFAFMRRPDLRFADRHDLTCGSRNGTRHTISNKTLGCLCLTCSHYSKNRSSHSTGKACRHETPLQNNSRKKTCVVRGGRERHFRSVLRRCGVFSRRP